MSEYINTNKIGLIYTDLEDNQVRAEQTLEDKIPEHKGTIIIQF